jgi:hypothetical protein
MSSYEQATALLNQVPENKLDYIVTYLQGFLAGIHCADNAAVDPFYSESNMAHLRRGVAALNAGHGVAHELIEDEGA